MIKYLLITFFILGASMQGYNKNDADIIKMDLEGRLKVTFINEIGLQKVYENVYYLSENASAYIVSDRDGEMGRHTKANNTKMSYEIVEK